VKKEVLKKAFDKISEKFLILGGIVVVLMIVVVVIIITTSKPPSPPTSEELEEGPVYEVVIGDIEFKLVEAKDRGGALEIPEGEEYLMRRDTDLTTKEKFIEVTISAENIGKENIRIGSWDIKELINGKERHFDYSQEASPWIPETSQCGTLLKPGFTPTLCTKIYEVAKVSTDLKVRVYSRQQTKTGFFQEEEAFIDLGL